MYYIKTAERPDLKFWIQDDDGALIDFSTGYTFTFKVGYKDQAALLTKTTVTGAAGAGVEPTGTPNITVTFTAGDWDTVPAGRDYLAQIRATTGGLDRVVQIPFEVRSVVT